MKKILLASMYNEFDAMDASIFSCHENEKLTCILDSVKF